MQKLWRWVITLFGLNLFFAVAGNLGIFSALAEVIEGEVCYKVAQDESTADKRTEAGVEDEGAGERQIRLKTKKAFLVCDRALIDLEVLRSLQPEVTQGAGGGAGQVEGDTSGGTSAAPVTGPGSGTGTGGGGGGGSSSSGSSGATTEGGGQSSVGGPGEESAQAPDSPNNEVSGTAGLFEETSCSVPEPTGCSVLTANGIVGPDDAKTLCLAEDTGICPAGSEQARCAIVGPGTYTYKFVHVLNGGTLFFKDDDPGGTKTQFLASSILVEQGGSVEAGTAMCPFGSNNGQLTIGLWGAAATNSGQVPPGAPISCLSNNGNCYPPGYESGHYCTVPGSSDPCSATEKNAIGDNALFEGYNPLPNDGGAIFGYKVFAVSYGGNVQLFGKKGVKTDAATPPNTCPTPANQFNVQDWADLTDSSWTRLSQDATPSSSMLTLDRQVDWAGGDPGKGDKIVVSTTDWHASHSELVEIKSIQPFNLTVCAGGPNAGSQCTTSPPNQCPASTCSGQKQVSRLTLQATTPLQYRHRGQLLPVPSDLSKTTMNPNTQLDPRADVGLLSRDIAIVSKGPTAADTDNFPKPPDCKTDTADCYFGGHFIVRQGFKNVQIRGVEFRQLGQGANMGHYPVHFHLAKSTGYTTPLIEDNSIWDSMTRFVVLHATHDVPVSRNVGYLSMGHGYYLEDGSEINNLLCQNLAVSARGSLKEYFTAQQVENQNKPTARYVPPILDGSHTTTVSHCMDLMVCMGGNEEGKVCTDNGMCGGVGASCAPKICTADNMCGGGGDSCVPPAVNIHGSDSYFPVPFWAMNAYNEFVGNKAAGVHGFGSCYWLLGSGVSGPSSTTLHWTEGSDTPQDYANFNVAGTQQAPLKRFRNNACTTAAYALQTTLDVEPTTAANARYQAATSPYPPLSPEMRPLISGNFTPVSFGPTFADKNPQTSDMVGAVASESQCDANGSALTMPNDIFGNVLSNITFNPNGEGALKVEGFSSPQNDGNLTAFNQKGTGGGKICVKDMLADEAAGPQVILAPQTVIATDPACNQGLKAGNENQWAINAQHCVTTVIDRFTTSFNWSQVNFGSVWLRPQFYLFLNSSITDQLTGGLGFVSGGGWQQAPPGYFTITKNSVFSGTSQSTGPGQPGWAGPTGPILTKATAAANCGSGLCLFPEDGTALFMGGLNPKRLITIYDGPSYSQGSIFLKTGTIRDTPPSGGQAIPGCLATQQGAGDDTVLTCGIYQSTVQPSAAGIAGGAGRMFVEDAGIGWKQTNGFYYPPAFAYAYTAFEKYHANDDPVCFSLVRQDNPPPEFAPEPRSQICRHNVLDQYVTYAQGSVEQPNNPVKTAVLGTVDNALGINITPIDFGTILNDLDGTLTGWVPEDAGTRTSSLSRNEFFDAPSQDAECNSFGTQTTPFEMVTTVVSKLKGSNLPNYVDSAAWGGNKPPPPPFPAVAIYRQQRVGGESAEPCKAICGEGDQNEEWSCNRATFMSGGQTGGAPYLTMNNGVYYIDTGSKSTSTDPQRLDCVAGAWGVCNGGTSAGTRCLDSSICAGGGTCDSQWFLPEFMSGQTYIIYNLFATEETNINYQLYIGGKAGDSIDGQFVRVKPHVSDPGGTGNDIEVVPCADCTTMKAVRNSHVPGVLDLTFDYAGMTADFDFVQRSENEKCLPRDICEIPAGEPSECVVASTFKTAEPDLEGTVDEICQFWVRATAGTTDFETTRPDGTKIQTPTSFADCPEGGCVGYAFTLPTGFEPQPYSVVGEPAATDADKTACFDPAIFNKPMENVDTVACPNPKAPTSADFCVATIGG